MPASALLSLQQVSLTRGERVLVDRLSFTVRAHDVVRLAGDNGSGKSSLLKVLAGLSHDYQGELTRAEHWQQQSIYLGHANAVKTLLTPEENLTLFASLYPCKTDYSIEQALVDVGLAVFAEQPCYQLSQGQKQRVALARLLLSAAQIWLLDEPFTAIDYKAVDLFESIIADFAKAGGAVVLTTHHALSMPETVNYHCIPLGAHHEQR